MATTTFPSEVQRIVFLGDSITYAGGYITRFAAALAKAGLKAEVLNLGLPSETCSGLSEPGHAGGAFPRPDVHERFTRVVSMTRPDMLIACYGMNCGMYYPYSEERSESYRRGRQMIQGFGSRQGARVIHLTPPVFDPKPLKGRTLPAGQAEYPQPYEGYDEVLSRYAEWLLQQREKQKWEVIDTRAPLVETLAAKRRSQPEFLLASDGVHLGDEGHWLMAKELLKYWALPGFDAESDADFTKIVGPDVLKRSGQIQHLLKDAWLNTCGHKRPGMKWGLPLHEAYAAIKALKE